MNGNESILSYGLQVWHFKKKTGVLALGWVGKNIRERHP
jgi:hypothetical protein